MSKSYTAGQIVEHFKNDITSMVGSHSVEFNTFSSADSPKKDALVWIKSSLLTSEFLEASLVAVCVTDSIPANVSDSHNKFLIATEKPKLLFIKLLNHFFRSKPIWGVHPTATISPEAKIDSEVYIGPNCVIGKAEVGNGCVLEGNNFVYDNVRLGRNVVLQAGAVIGSKGMSLAREVDGTLLDFPSLGEVVVEDNVEIGSNAVVDAAVLEKTVIGAGTRINSLTFIGNSAIIGRDNYISVCVNINGSVVIGDRNFIGSGSSIRNKAKIGSDNTIGSGSIVVKDIGNTITVYGNPAKESDRSKGIRL